MRFVARAMILTAATMAVWIYLVRYSERTGGEISACRVSYVYDGDTVALDCGGPDEITARVLGLDAPETKSPGCAEELVQGKLATGRLRDLVATGEVSFKRVGVDKYDRPLIRLKVDGVDVAERLIGEGLAVPYAGGKRISWCDRLKAA